MWSRSLIKIECHTCGKSFYRELRWIKYNQRIGQNNYCSKRCGYEKLRTGEYLVCENPNCGKKFYKIKNQISEHNFCSRSCAVTVNNTKYPKIGLSKEEKYSICLICKKRFFTGWKKRKLCSKECYSMYRKAKIRYSKEELLRKIKLSVEQTGRIPAKRELHDIHNISIHTFGTWNNAIRAAGFEPNRSHDDRMYKRTKTIAADGHICDSISEALIDNWLSQHNISHERDVSYPTTNHKADWAINKGKTFIEYFGLAKDSPRYDRAVRNKKRLCQNHDIRLIEIYPKDLYPKISLESKLGPS